MKLHYLVFLFFICACTTSDYVLEENIRDCGSEEIVELNPNKVYSTFTRELTSILYGPSIFTTIRASSSGERLTVFLDEEGEVLQEMKELEFGTVRGFSYKSIFYTGLFNEFFVYDIESEESSLIYGNEDNRVGNSFFIARQKAYIIEELEEETTINIYRWDEDLERIDLIYKIEKEGRFSAGVLTWMNQNDKLIISIDWVENNRHRLSNYNIDQRVEMHSELIENTRDNFMRFRTSSLFVRNDEVKIFLNSNVDNLDAYVDVNTLEISYRQGDKINEQFEIVDGGIYDNIADTIHLFKKPFFNTFITNQLGFHFTYNNTLYYRTEEEVIGIDLNTLCPVKKFTLNPHRQESFNSRFISFNKRNGKLFYQIGFNINRFQLE